jgi:hypothetical protein
MIDHGMEEFLKNLDYQNVGSSVLQLVTFLVVVIVVIAILDRWSPHKPPMPPENGTKPEPDDQGESQVLKEDSSPIPLEGDEPNADEKDPLNRDKDEKLPPPSM